MKRKNIKAKQKRTEELTGGLQRIQHCFICRPTDSTVSEDAGIEPSAGIFKQSKGATNRVGIGLSYRSTRLAELIPWNQFLGSLKG